MAQEKAPQGTLYELRTKKANKFSALPKMQECAQRTEEEALTEKEVLQLWYENLPTVQRTHFPLYLFQEQARMAQVVQEQSILARDLQTKRAATLLNDQSLADMMEATDNDAIKAGFSCERWYYIFGKEET